MQETLYLKYQRKLDFSYLDQFLVLNRCRLNWTSFNSSQPNLSLCKAAGWIRSDRYKRRNSSVLYSRPIPRTGILLYWHLFWFYSSPFPTTRPTLSQFQSSKIRRRKRFLIYMKLAELLILRL